MQGIWVHVDLTFTLNSTIIEVDGIYGDGTFLAPDATFGQALLLSASPRFSGDEMLMSVSTTPPFAVHMGSVDVSTSSSNSVSSCSVRYHLLEALPSPPHCTIGQCYGALLLIWTLKGSQCLTLSQNP
jgi:hypothetical protein